MSKLKISGLGEWASESHAEFIDKIKDEYCPIYTGMTRMDKRAKKYKDRLIIEAENIINHLESVA